ncbi:LLM class flavin-dependent oxidoreductase [Kribbella swartbergensis]
MPGHHLSRVGCCRRGRGGSTVGTNILVLPLHQPLRVAQEAAVVDPMPGGRMMLGAGQAYLEGEFAAFGLDRRRRRGAARGGRAVHPGGMVG